jgi:predicted SAM-dependent methyltransferase
MINLVKAIPLIYALAHKVRFCYRRRMGSYRFRRQLKVAAPLRIVVGASGVFDQGWVPAEVEFLNLLNLAHWQEYFGASSIDAILAEHVWEHLTWEEGLQAARNCCRFLKIGAYVRAAVPDGFHPNPTYIEQVRMGGLGLGADEHKVLYNHDTFRGLFEKAGFTVNLLEYFDSGGRFHFVEWDPGKGKIRRSKRYDARNTEGSLTYTSIILDAYKNA